MKKVTSTEYEAFKKNVWTAFLKNANDEDIHMSVLTVNYGDLHDVNHPLLNHVLNNAAVDSGTVLAFYWRMQPQYSRLAWIQQIEQKYQDGFYRQHRIFFNPQNDGHENWTSVLGNASFVRKTPAAMAEANHGETVPELFTAPEFEDGLPLSYLEKIDQYLDENEIVD